MGFSGNLEDASLADIAQFIQLGGRTGTLHLESPEGRGRVGFHRGHIVSATAPSSRRLGEELVAKGVLDASALGAALHVQQVERPRQSLGRILVARGAITAETLRDTMAQKIVETVAELVSWSAGTFEFTLDELAPPDDLGLYPRAMIPTISLDTKVVLLEAMQLIDEHDRRRRRDAPTQPPPRRSSAPTSTSAADEGSAVQIAERLGVESSPSHGALPPTARAKVQLQILTDDPALAIALCADGHESWTVARVALRDAGSSLPSDPPPIVLVDLRGNASLKASIAHVRRTRPRATILAMVQPSDHAAALYAAGALVLLPPDIGLITACVHNILLNRADHSPDSAIADGVRSGLARLRRITGDLRAGALSSTVSLNLMHAVSESVERAILFVVRRDAMVALGAFGYDTTGHPLAERTRGLQIPIESARTLAECVEDGHARVGLHEDHPMPGIVAEFLGRPRSGQVVVLPVHGGQRTMAVVYADNGMTDRTIEGIEVLELAVTQMGLAFENELLRRQLRSIGGTSSP